MFEDKTQENLLQEFLERVDLPLAKNEGSILYGYGSATALTHASIYADMAELFNRAFLINCQSDDIDNRAKEFGIYRKEGTRARGNVIISGADETEIEDGTIILHGGNRYEILGRVDPYIIKDGTCTCFAEATENGKEYNVPSGAVFTLEKANEKITKIVTEEVWANGSSRESDDEFKERFFYLRRHKGTSGNVNDYTNWGLAVDGVKHVKVIPRYNGAGSVKVVIMGDKNRNVEGEVLKNAKEFIEKKRPLTVKDLKIVTPTPVLININATIETLDDDLSYIKQTFINMLDSYLINATEEVTYSKIYGLLSSIEEVVDFKNLTINSGAKNIKLHNEEIGAVGTVTFDKGSVD